MGKYFGESTSDHLEKNARLKLFRNFGKGLLQRIPGYSKATTTIAKSKPVKALKKTKPYKATQRTVAFIDDPAKFLTKNKRSPYYIKDGRILSADSRRKALYVGGKTLGYPVRHPIQTAGGIIAWDQYKQNQSDKEYDRKAYKTSFMTDKDLQTDVANTYDDYFNSPSTAEINRVMGTKFTDDEVKKNMQLQSAAHAKVKGLALKNNVYDYDNLNLGTNIGWDYSVGDSLIGARNNVYQGLHHLADPKFTGRYYDKPIDKKRSKNIYSEIKNSSHN